MTGLENIDCVLKDELEVFLAAKPTPKSDVLATYEIEYSAQDEGGEKYSKIRTVHIGMLAFGFALFSGCRPAGVLLYVQLYVQCMRRHQRSRLKVESMCATSKASPIMISALMPQ